MSIEQEEIIVAGGTPQEAPTRQQLATTGSGTMRIDPTDIDIPRLNVVQKLSDIDAPVGSLVLGKQHVLVKPDEVLPVVVLRADKGEREDIPFGTQGAAPRWSFDPAEIAALKAESSYKWLEFADITIMFRQPDGVDDEAAYPFPIAGGHWAIGRLNVAKDAYRQTYKRLATYQQFNETPLQHKLWNFRTMLLTKGPHSWWAPALENGNGAQPDDVIEFVDSFRGA